MHYEKFADGNTICIEEETELMWPSTWVATRLKNIIELLSGRDLSPNQYTDIPNGIPYITGASNFLCGEIKTDRFTPVPQVIVYKGDLLITCKGTVGELAYCPYEQAHIARQIMAIRNSFGLNLEYICNCVRFYVEKIKNSAKGLIPGISREDMLNLIIPLPPLNEQVKINSQINVLMKSIKSIDEKSQSLTTDIGNLKSKILDLAIRGKLVSQNPDDEPASILLERIRAEKEELIKQGKIKRDKKESIIFKGEDNSYYEKFADNSIKCIDDEIPFKLPISWEWCKIGDIFTHNTGKALNSSDTNGTPMTYITTSNLYWDSFILDALKKMNFLDNEIEKCTVRKGDLLVCEGGDIGRAAIWQKDEETRIQNHIHKLRPLIELSNRFYYYVFLLWKQTDRIGGRGIGLQGFSSKALHNLVVPLPPIREQIDIVTQVDSIFEILDSIEKSLD